VSTGNAIVYGPASGESNMVTVAGAVPATNLTAKNVGTGSCSSATSCGVNVTWNNSNLSGSLTSVVVTRSDNVVVATLTGAQITASGTITDTAATANTNYSYTVSVNSGASTLPANSNSVTTQVYLPAPTIGTATQVDGTTMQVTYTDNAYGETVYAVEMSVNGGAWSGLPAWQVSAPVNLGVAGSSGVSTATIGWLPLTTNDTYKFRVFAYANSVSTGNAIVYGPASGESNMVTVP
jgi:hypothetical protein